MLFRKGHPSNETNEPQVFIEKKELSRGMFYIPLTSKANIRDAEQFLTIYEKYTGSKIADLSEIALLRGLA